MAPAPAQAQVRGQVVDTDGRPLPGVLVELWDAGRRLAGDGTDPRGWFRLPAVPASGPRALVARGIGLDPARRVLGTRDSVVIVVMRPHAIELAPALVLARRGPCPDSDDARARHAWERAARHYDVALSAYGVQTDVHVFSALVPWDSIGVIDTTRLVRTFIGGGYSALAFATRFTTAGNYYAVRAASRRPVRFDRWSYQLLESSRAWHFADTFFASMNRLSLEEDPAGDTVIAFCSTDGAHPGIRGRIRLAPDSTLASADWEFVTPSAPEDAGGRVLFAPVDSARRGQALVPMAGLFWRKVPRGVYQEWMEYRQWFRCESSTSCEAPMPLGPPPGGRGALPAAPLERPAPPPA